MSTLLTSTRRRGRSWNFRKPFAIGAQRDLVVDARGHVAEMRGRHVLAADRLEIEHVDRVLGRLDELVRAHRRPHQRIGQLAPGDQSFAGEGEEPAGGQAAGCPPEIAGTCGGWQLVRQTTAWRTLPQHAPPPALSAGMSAAVGASYTALQVGRAARPTSAEAQSRENSTQPSQETTSEHHHADRCRKTRRLFASCMRRDASSSPIRGTSAPRAICRPRLQGAGPTSSGFAHARGFADGARAARHDARAFARDRRGDRRSGQCRFRGRLCGRPEGVGGKRAALHRDRRRRAVDRGFAPAILRYRSTISTSHWRACAPRVPRSTRRAAMSSSPRAPKASFADGPDLAETIRRLKAFADAGADCLYSPGDQDARGDRGDREGGRAQAGQLSDVDRPGLHGERSRRHGRAPHQRRRHARARRLERGHPCGARDRRATASSTASPA